MDTGSDVFKSSDYIDPDFYGDDAFDKVDFWRFVSREEYPVRFFIGGTFQFYIITYSDTDFQLTNGDTGEKHSLDISNSLDISTIEETKPSWNNVHIVDRKLMLHQYYVHHSLTQVKHDH